MLVGVGRPGLVAAVLRGGGLGLPGLSPAFGGSVYGLRKATAMFRVPALSRTFASIGRRVLGIGRRQLELLDDRRRSTRNAAADRLVAELLAVDLDADRVVALVDVALHRRSAPCRAGTCRRPRRGAAGPEATRGGC